MPRYKVIDAPTYIDSTMRQPGEVVEYGGWPGSTLEPVDSVAKRVKDVYAVATKRGGRKHLARVPELALYADPPAESVQETKPPKPPKPVKDE